MSSKKTTTTNENYNSTTTPTPPGFATSDLTNLSGMTENLAKQDPQSFVAPSSPLQNAAFSDAGSLNAWQPFVSTGGSLAAQAGSAGPTFAQTAPAPPTAVTNAYGYAPTSTGSTGYSPTDYKSTGYNPSLITDPASIAPTTNATAGKSGAAGLLDGGLTKYLDPYIQNVMQSDLADLGQMFGQQNAALAAQGANAEAFGGSRWGLEQAQLADNQSRQRNDVISNLLSTGFNNATTLANEDAARRQEADLQNAGAQTNVSLANAGAANTRSTNIADLMQQALLANQGAADTAKQFGASAANTAGQYGAEAANTAASQGAAAANQAASQNAAAANTAASQGAAAQNQAGQFDAASQNSMASMIFQALNQGGEFNAGQANTANAQKLQAADILGNLGGQTANAGINTADALANLGGVQRDITQSQATAPISLAQTIAQLLGQNQFGLLTGQNTAGTASGTQTTSTSPGLASILGSVIGGIGSLLPAGGLAKLFGGGSIPMINSAVGGAANSGIGMGADPALASLFG